MRRTVCTPHWNVENSNFMGEISLRLRTISCKRDPVCKRTTFVTSLTLRYYFVRNLQIPFATYGLAILRTAKP